MIKWKTNYVSEGSIEPDEHGRWDMVGTVNGLPVVIIDQKPMSTIHKFGAWVLDPSFSNGHVGFTKYMYENNLEQLKKNVEQHITTLISKLNEAQRV